MRIYEITTPNLELPQGTRFTIDGGPVEMASLCLFKVGANFVLGRWISDVIIQPTRWLYCGAIAIKCLGKVVLLVAI